MIRLAAATAALALGLSTASFAQTTGPIGQQDTAKPGTANPNTPNMASDNGIVGAPNPMPDGAIERRTIGSAVSRPTEVVPRTRRDPSIDGSAGR
jgi:hypothetical protein